MDSTHQDASKSNGFIERMLNRIEIVGNKLPDPAMLFLFSLIIVWILSSIMSGMSFADIDPRTGEAIVIKNLLAGDAMATFLSQMVTIFTGFAPLGVVLVAMLGVGVADEAGYFNTSIKMTLSWTPKALMTPMVILVGLISHSAVDAGYVLVIPLGGIIFYAVGRHPMAGIAAAFAGVSGGFSANPLPGAIDPLLQGFTQPAAQIIDPSVLVNPLGNYFFTSISSVLIIGLGWLITDKIIEPRLNRTTPVDADIEEADDMSSISPTERKAFIWSTLTMMLGLAHYAVHCATHLLALSDSWCGVWLCHRKVQEIERYGGCHVQGHEWDVLLHRDGLLLCAVRLRIRQLEYWCLDRSKGRFLAESVGLSWWRHHFRYRFSGCIREPVCRIGIS